MRQQILARTSRCSYRNPKTGEVREAVVREVLQGSRRGHWLLVGRSRFDRSRYASSLSAARRRVDNHYCKPERGTRWVKQGSWSTVSKQMG